MDIETQRVWDYAGDNYVHRLIQNKSDGKLVELPSALADPNHPNYENPVPCEKLENIGMEYTYLLTSQLESQRLYYEEKIAKAADKASSATATAEKATADAAAAIASLKLIEEKYNHLSNDVVPEFERATARAESRAQKFAEMAKRMEREWNDEKGVNEGLLERVQHLNKQNEVRTEEIRDLKEQVRDLMFFLQARDKMEYAGEDVQEGTVTVADPPPPPPSHGKESKRKKGKGKR
jgi:BRCA1-associated protein